MNLVIAVKAEPKRQARVTKPQYVTLLLTTSAEAADPSVLHRDGEYNSKLQGTCFSCSKLNANPPQSVCEVPGPDTPPTGCVTIDDDPCVCANCPPPPPSRACACSQGYPAPNTAGLGSGYWVGLQANTYYSNVTNGGWVVAVSCTSSEILGAFPVTGSNFGYGAGDIGGNPVMIYPAGAINGAGYFPANETSFPIIALTPTDGNLLIGAGSFTIASGSTQPRCPATNPQYFCDASNSFLYEGYPKPCLAKYPREESGCSTFDNFTEWPSDKPYDDEQNPYFINMSGVTGFTSQSTGSISFTSSTGQKYCGTIQDWIQKPNDALTGACGGTEWVDPPSAFYDNCIDCTSENVKVPCEYVLNLTNGQVDLTYGGYSSAGGNGFFGIGPAFPPTTIDSGSISSSDLGSGVYWNTFWDWTPGTYTYNGSGETQQVFIPPISKLLNECKCPDDQARDGSIIFIESFSCCESQIGGLPTGISAIKPFTPGYSACGATCYSSCVNMNCSCNFETTSEKLGRPDTYGYIPCSECNSPAGTIEPVTGIWWTVQTETGLGAIYSPRTVNGSLSEPGPDNSCFNVYNSFENPQCACGSLFNQSLENPNKYDLDLNKLKNCVPFNGDSIDDLLNDPCFRSQYLPAAYKDCVLTFSGETIDTGSYVDFPYGSILANHILVSGNNCPCESGTSLMSCLCNNVDAHDCWLRNIGGPLSIPVKANGNVCEPFLGALFGCSLPVKEEKQVTDCNNNPVSAPGLVFKEISNDKCINPTDKNGNPKYTQSEFDNLIKDPCGCCSQNIVMGSGEMPTDQVQCGNGSGTEGPCQADCCQGSGCANGDCPPPADDILTGGCG